MQLGAGASNRLVIDPGATFRGTVTGGNAIGGTAISTLELASGAGAGTLTGLGTTYIDFAHITIDAAADWVLGGVNSLVAGATLSNGGALTDTGGLINAGTLTGGSLRLNGGALTNQAGGLVTSAYVYGAASGGADSIINLGTIADTAVGVYLEAAGTVINAAGALIAGNNGVVLGAGGTVANAGTIASNHGTSGVAVLFTGVNSRLIADPGAAFIGAVSGSAYTGARGSAVLELASGSSAGTLAGLGSTVTNFTSLVFDAGARWTVAGDDAVSGLGALDISGFTFGDTIDLTGFQAVNRAFASNLLTLGDGVGDYQTLHIQGTYASGNFKITSDGSGGTDIAFQTIQSAPSVTAGGVVTFAVGGPAVTLDSGLVVTDAGSATLAGATIWIGSGFTSGDLLNFQSAGAITGSYDASTGTLTLSGIASWPTTRRRWTRSLTASRQQRRSDRRRGTSAGPSTGW